MQHVTKFRQFTKLLFLSGLLFFSASASAGDGDTTYVSIFTENGIHWGDRTFFENDSIEAFFGGRIIEHDEVVIPEFSNPVRITGMLEVIPDDNGVPCSADPWDKAGNITLLRPFEEPIELSKFITGYGGNTFHEEDLSFLAPLLKGELRIQAHIDTWLTPAWKVTYTLMFVEDASYENPAWVKPIYYNQDLKRTDITSNEPSISVDVPVGLDSMQIAYFTSGHSNIGSGGDEFITKANVIYVNGQEVYRNSPWRTDCGNFGNVNPCGNFPPSRSGWCPGDEVHPVMVDVNTQINVGEQIIRHSIEDVQANQGFWRVSSYLYGYSNGSASTPSAIQLEDLEGTELSVNESAAMRIRLRDAFGFWIYNASGTVTLNSDNSDIQFLDNTGNWTSTPDVSVTSGELLAYVRGIEAVQGAKVWATDASGTMQASDTLYFNITQTFGDTTGFALELDGVDDYIDAGNSPSLRLTGNQITMEAKIYPNQFAGAVWASSVIVKDQGGSPGQDRGYMLRVGGNGQVNINLGDGNWNELSSSEGVVAEQLWNHVAGTYDGQRLRLYVNGNLVGESGTVNMSIGDTDMQNLLIGESPQFPGRPFNGMIDEVRLWNVARTEAQIQQTIIGQLDSTYYATADSGLVGYWRMDDGTGQIAADLSVNGNNGILGSSISGDMNDPTWVNLDPTVGIEDPVLTAPQQFSLEQNYPNPFNPSTTISYQIPARFHVKLKVYDLLGREVQVLVNDLREAGKHEITFNASNFASGVYYYRLEAGEVVKTEKMMLLK
ncbi:MAG: LamG-like jellyroll fold domain-containing protein [Calditrichota bacterium]